MTPHFFNKLLTVLSYHTKHPTRIARPASQNRAKYNMSGVLSYLQHLSLPFNTSTDQMSDGDTYAVILDGFGVGLVASDSLVWVKPTSNLRRLKKEVTQWLQRKHHVVVPAMCNIYVNHEEQTITLRKMVERPQPKGTHRVVRIDDDLLASIRC